MSGWFHEQRLDEVVAALLECGAGSVLDLGCGEGALLARLAPEPGIRRLVGVDLSAPALALARVRLETCGMAAKAELLTGCLTVFGDRLTGFDAAALVETIEHIEPDHLSRLERTVFGRMRPGVVIVTTPNSEFNGLLGVPPWRLRHPDHRFEWTRRRFRTWAQGVAERSGYGARFRDIGGAHPDLGAATQMAVFRRASPLGGRSAA